MEDKIPQTDWGHQFFVYVKILASNLDPDTGNLNWQFSSLRSVHLDKFEDSISNISRLLPIIDSYPVTHSYHIAALNKQRHEQ
jgi:hypothetical protein